MTRLLLCSIRVTVTRPEPARVRIGVVDKSKRLPQLRKRARVTRAGRGLMLVGALAKEWGTDHLPWDKRVWAELHGEQRR
ncbi:MULTISPECIES: hypothetical protein [Streptomyces]|uniref:hypothetical protein n=1 Tax=Streptomyces TaxID=1883 RepID=UPI00287F70E7|nr:hypothetical protein [Streptomyces sp. CGMCC 4.1456]WNF63763.1 hypothetical protein RJD14_14765 [Streptomyces sp. CGMCC 4.1456]